MFEILVNNLPVQLLQPIQNVVSLSIRHFVGGVIPIKEGYKTKISTWLYDLSQRATHTITYNGVIISKESVNDIK